MSAPKDKNLDKSSELKDQVLNPLTVTLNRAYEQKHRGNLSPEAFRQINDLIKQITQLVRQDAQRLAEKETKLRPMRLVSLNTNESGTADRPGGKSPGHLSKEDV